MIAVVPRLVTAATPVGGGTISGVRIWRDHIALAIALVHVGCFGHTSIILHRDAPRGTVDCGFAVVESMAYTAAAVGLGVLDRRTVAEIAGGVSSSGYAAARRAQKSTHALLDSWEYE